jgi:CHAT domain-containing protein
MKLKILFVSANPALDLKLDEEYKAIEQGIIESEYRDYIDIKVKLACEYDNLMDAVNEEKPDIVHFSGHGEGERGLKFYSPDLENNVEFIDAELIGELFETANENLKLVVLNSCHSIVQAREIVKHIDYVIGMNDEIGDEAAITLMSRFYKSFASDNVTISGAFKQALNQIKRKFPQEADIPKLLKKEEGLQDIKISDIIGKKEKEKKQNEESIANDKGGTNIDVSGDVKGIVSVSGGTVNQTITKKTINAEKNFENIKNDGIMSIN